MKRYSTLITFIVSFLIVGSISLIFLFPDKVQEKTAPADSAAQTGQTNGNRQAEPGLGPNENPLPGQADSGTSTPEPKELLLRTSRELADAIGNVIRNKDMETLRALELMKAISAEDSLLLQDLLTARHIRLADNSISSVGINNHGKNPTARYAINFSSGARGYMDLERNSDNMWVLKKIYLPDKKALAKDKSAPMVLTDSMGTVSSFMEAVGKTNVREAKRFVDPTKVSDATIVGLCILFEEGSFRLRTDAPIKTAYEADNNAGYFVHLQDSNGKKVGSIGLTLSKKSGNWLITEAALDNMLDYYTRQNGAGDDFFIPLVKNPKGGDSLVLFFGFNEDTLTKRSVHQLKIVADSLNVTKNKKLEISGHTDDVGSEEYNQGLSERRAAAVKNQLIEFGVAPSLIVTKGFGKSQPRRTYSDSANETDRDEARKENRRAEMYLDF